MKFQIDNGPVRIESPEHAPETLECSFHCDSRELEFRARYCRPAPGNHDPDPKPYVSLSIDIGPASYEEGDRPRAYARMFLTREQAAELRDTLTATLEESHRTPEDAA